MSTPVSLSLFTGSYQQPYRIPGEWVGLQYKQTLLETLQDELDIGYGFPKRIMPNVNLFHTYHKLSCVNVTFSAREITRRGITGLRRRLTVFYY